MKYTFLAINALLGIVGATAYADEPVEQPRTHIDTTVVGSSTHADPNVATESASLTSDHDFQAGAPDLLKITNQLHLSAQQKAQLNDAIERADAGAAVLIKREHDVKEMVAATTPEDPLYAKLIAEQATQNDRWNENRDGLRRDVLALLTPPQRTRFEELQASR